MGLCVDRKRGKNIITNVITFTDWNRMPLGEWNAFIFKCFDKFLG